MSTGAAELVKLGSFVLLIWALACSGDIALDTAKQNKHRENLQTKTFVIEDGIIIRNTWNLFFLSEMINSVKIMILGVVIMKSSVRLSLHEL